MKNIRKYDDGIIDSCVRNPEKLLSYKLTGNHVKVNGKDKTDQEALLTADLIEETFHSSSAGIRRDAGRIPRKK